MNGPFYVRMEVILWSTRIVHNGLQTIELAMSILAWWSSGRCELSLSRVVDLEPTPSSPRHGTTGHQIDCLCIVWGSPVAYPEQTPGANIAYTSALIEKNDRPLLTHVRVSMGRTSYVSVDNSRGEIIVGDKGLKLLILY